MIVALAPALPLHEAGKYVAGAYVVLFVIVLIYVAIMAVRLSRIERELGELLELAGGDRQPPHAGGEPDDTRGTIAGRVGSTGIDSPESAARTESTLA
ncbi:MAG TPA: hypothetical protein VII53_09160 [Solirubrobacteraceae bacterium]